MTLLLVHAAATWFLTGLIWVIQRVHYPLFDRVEAARFEAFATDHANRITWIVAPAMAVEALSGAALLLQHEGSGAALWAGAALLAVVWGSTFFVQVPCHARLARGFDAAAHARLVRTNWVRTAAWTGRAVLVGWMLLEAAA